MNIRINWKLMYLVGLLTLFALLWGCSPCEPIIREVTTEVPIIDTFYIYLPAESDSVKGEVDIESFLGTFTKEKDTVLVVRFYPKDTSFTYRSYPDTVVKIVNDTVKVTIDCPEEKTSFWTYLGSAGVGMALMVMLLLLVNGFKPEWLGSIAGIFKK